MLAVPHTYSGTDSRGEWLSSNGFYAGPIYNLGNYKSDVIGVLTETLDLTDKEYAETYLATSCCVDTEEYNKRLQDCGFNKIFIEQFSYINNGLGPNEPDTQRLESYSLKIIVDRVQFFDKVSNNGGVIA